MLERELGVEVENPRRSHRQVGSDPMKRSLQAVRLDDVVQAIEEAERGVECFAPILRNLCSSTKQQNKR